MGFTLSTIRAPPPPFIGYQSPTTRIDPVNLTEIVRARKNNEISTNITIHTEHRDEREYVEWDRFMGKGNARISFANVKTKYSYNFNGNDEKTTLPIFWTKLKKYLHLSDEELQSEIFKFNKRVEEQSFGYYRYANGAIDWKKPDYELILADLGEILDFDNSEIGFETTIYKDTTWSEYNTKCIVRSRFYTKYLVVETEIENPSASIVLLIDGDSDIQIEIWCREKLDDPTTVLVDLFDQIGIPTTILDSLELEEWYSGYY